MRPSCKKKKKNQLPTSESKSLPMRTHASGSSVVDGCTGGRHVHCVMEIGLITDKSYGGAAKRFQLPTQCNVITAEEVEDGDGKAERKDADHH